MSYTNDLGTDQMVDELVRKIVYSRNLMLVINPRTHDRGLHIEALDVIHPPSLDIMQEKVGGTVEHVLSTFSVLAGKTMQVYVNEEGRLQGLPENTFGTGLVGKLTGISLPHVIVGPIVILLGRNIIWL
jgi:hypothetical protein